MIRFPLLPFICTGVGPLLSCLEESRDLITDHDDLNEEETCNFIMIELFPSVAVESVENHSTQLKQTFQAFILTASTGGLRDSTLYA